VFSLDLFFEGTVTCGVAGASSAFVGTQFSNLAESPQFVMRVEKRQGIFGYLLVSLCCTYVKDILELKRGRVLVHATPYNSDSICAMKTDEV
jgi:hypothetical protein